MEIGRMRVMNLLTLDRIEKDTEVEVSEIVGGWGARHQLNRLGIHPGDVLCVKRSGFMNGPILIRVHGMEVALGKRMAKKVMVTKKKMHADDKKK